MWYRLNRAFFRVWYRLHFGFRIEGRHHEPPPPYIIIANHTSAVDIPLMAIAVRAPVAFVAKEELMRIGAVRVWIRSLGGFFVRRGEPDRAAVRTALGLLRRGRVLGIFAEGTRSLDGRLQPFEEGAAYWALKAGVPVLPVAIIGSHRTMPAGAKWPRRSPVVVRIGPPLAVPRVEARLRREVVQEWTRKLHQALADLLPADQRPLSEIAGTPTV
jgi:1-acyl-sn-glycerol-3-phosphate acyltransferase